MTTRPVYMTLFLLIASVCASAQVVDTTICDILANPRSFDGKTVRVKSTASAGFDEFILKDASCNQPINAVWLSYPEATKAKAGPLALIEVQAGRNLAVPVAQVQRTPVKLEKNKDFKQFDALLSTAHKGGGMCLGCGRYTVSATFVGRLDGVDRAGIIRDASGKISDTAGFGNLSLYRARLVLQSVADITPHEIDYSATTAAKDDSVNEGQSGDPVASTRQAAKAFGVETDAGKQLERAAAAYGNEGEDNGVNVGFGPANEIRKNDGSKGDKDSPDGLLLNCTFDMDRLKGDALSRAMAHVGTHIADLRDSSPALTSYELEYRAWMTTILSALAYKQKTLTAPGGNLLWNSGWPAAERQKSVDDGLASFLTNWASLKK